MEKSSIPSLQDGATFDELLARLPAPDEDPGGEDADGEDTDPEDEDEREDGGEAS